MRFKRIQSIRAINRPIFTDVLEGRLLFAATPTVTSAIPAPGAVGVSLTAPIVVNLNLPNGAVDPLTDTTSNFYLYQTKYPNNNERFVPGWMQTINSGKSIAFMPLDNLLPNTSYTVVITAGLKDVNGDSFAPYTQTFTTGNFIPTVSQNYAFSEVNLPTAQGTHFTDVQIGPDGKLYASTTDGKILRFGINANGTLGSPLVITSLTTFYGVKRLISGFAFDPSFVADPTKPMLWVSNTYYAISNTNAPNFTSSLTVMSGPNLATVKDAITHLPRSVSDHVNDQPVFQPGTHNLFFCQAGVSAYGAPDATWGNRAETLLSAAILEVNTSALNLNGLALNVQTPDAGGTYNPYAAGAPVTIYATGIRNAFTLMFDDKGQLWAPTNGSSPGGNSPAGGGAPALTNIQQVETDTLEKVTQGAYFGHPNPSRNQFVLDQGNPTTGGIPSLAFTAYPKGTKPDPNYQTPNFLFGLHSSPDGMIEYHGSAFGGTLNGKFLVAEYSAPDNIVVLSRDSNNNIIGGLVSKVANPLPDRSVSGLTHLEDPVSLAEDPRTGFLYISEYGSSKLSLWVPSSIKPQLRASATSVAFSAIAAGHTGSKPSTVQTVTITNTGANPLNFSSISIINDPAASPAAVNFSIVNAASLPLTLASNGSSMTIQLQYNASIVGLQSAILQLKSNDPAHATFNISLHGTGTAS